MAEPGQIGTRQKPAQRPLSAQRIYGDPTLFSSARLCAPWRDPLLRAQLNERLRRMVLDRVRAELPPGFEMHVQSNHRLGIDCQANAEVTGQGVALKLRLPHNRIVIRLTTPDGIPGRLDPDVILSYDLEAETTLRLPDATGGRVRVGSIGIGATRIGTPQNRGISGGLRRVVDGLVRFLGGPEFAARLQQPRHTGVHPLMALDLRDWNHCLASADALDERRFETVSRGGQLVMRLTRRQASVVP